MSISHEGTLAALRQKHNNNMAEMGEQIDGLNKNKAKCEKEKSNMERDLAEARGALDEAMRERANLEKNCKMTQGLIVESNTKLDELARALNDADSTKKKLTIESQDLCRQIEVQLYLLLINVCSSYFVMCFDCLSANEYLYC